ncbi:uncharacterized protein LOC142523640 isoform X2 [Primulina tabacum]|uniref:uncharacterized protein LOC142523640 isoform X2 n=1 Tax=Primulina tabacum TaxID=48773 RepID=UPI003F599E84
MGSVGFCGESEPQPSTSNSKKFKLPRKLVDECCAVNNAAIPRKLRSAIKKRGLESMPNSKKQNPLRKSGAKKSRLNMKQGHITKDEKEVAETLYLLANMFYDAIKTDERGFDVHPSETNSSTVLETGSTMTAAQDAGKIAARATLEALCQTSNLEDSTSKIAQLKSFDDPLLSKLPISKQYPILLASEDRTNLVTSASKTKISALTTVPSDWGITMEQVAAPGIQNCPREDKNNVCEVDLLLWRSHLSSTVTQGTETLESCPRSSINKLPAWFDTTNHVIQHPTPEESFTKNKHHLVKAEPMRLRKRCSAHIYICHFIKVMQVSDRKEGLPGTLFEPGPHINIEYQKNGIDHTSGPLSFSVSSIQDTILLRKSLFQDQQQASKMHASCSPLKQVSSLVTLSDRLFVCHVSWTIKFLQGSDFLSLAGHSDEVLKQSHSSYMQSQNNLAMLLPQPQNCYSTFLDRSSAVAIEQLPPFHSSRVAALFAAQSPPAGLPTTYLQERENGESDSSFFVNCAQARPLFPHMHSSPGLNYQQFNTIHPPPSLSNVKGHGLRLPSGFDRNRATCYPGNMSQLQIFCNQQRL